MKKMYFHMIWYLILSLCFGLTIPSFSLAQTKPAAAPELPPLSQEEVDFFEKLFEGMDDETLEALAQIGEEYIKEMEAQGKDPYEILKEPLFPPAQAPAPKEEKPAAPQPPVIKLPEGKVEELKVILQNLISALQSIQQKTTNDRESRNLIAPWRYYIEDIIYFAHLLTEEKLFKFLLDKEFEDLYKNLKQLHENLMTLDSLYNVQEISLDADRNYAALGLSPIAPFTEVQTAYQTLTRTKKPDTVKKMMEGKDPQEIAKALQKNEEEMDAIHNAYQSILAREQEREILYQILYTLQEFVLKPDLINQFKKLVAQYDPEALKIKEAQEKREAEARKEQEELIKRRSIPSRPTFKTGTDFKPSGTFEKPFVPGIGQLPTIPGGAAAKDTGGTAADKKDGKKGGKKDDKKKDEKKKEDKEEKKEKPKLPEVSKNLLSRLEKIQEIFEELSDYVSKKIFNPDAKGEASLAPKDILKEIDIFMIGTIASPYEANNPVIIRAKQLIAVLNKITELTHRIKKEVRNTIGLSRQEKRDFKKAAQDLFDQYDKQLFKKDLAELMNLQITPDTRVISKGTPQEISKEKKYLLLGQIAFDEDIRDSQFELLRSLNPLIQAAEGEVPKAANLIGLFKNAYQELVKELKPQPVPGTPGIPAGKGAPEKHVASHLEIKQEVM